MQNLNEIKYIDGGGQLQVVEPISEYISTSEVVDANFSLTSSSTLQNLAGQILLTPTKIQRVSGMNGGATLEQVMRLVPSPSDSDIPTGVCTYLFKVISMPYNAMSTDSTSDALIQVFYYYDATFIATCIIAAGATSTTKSDWVDIAKLSAEDVATINTSADVIFQNPQNTSETANSEFRFLTSGKNDNAMPYGIAINSSGIRWIVGGSEYGYFLTTDGPNSNVKTINGESIYGSGDITTANAYMNTSEVYEYTSTLPSDTTISSLANLILESKSKVFLINYNTNTLTSLLGSIISTAPYFHYQFKVKSVIYNTNGTVKYGEIEANALNATYSQGLKGTLYKLYDYGDWMWTGWTAPGAGYLQLNKTSTGSMRQTVSAATGAEYEFTLTKTFLRKGKTYLFIGYVDADNSDGGSIVAASIKVCNTTKSNVVFERNVRTTMNSGGGCISSCFYECTADNYFVELFTYNYRGSTTTTLRGALDVFELAEV